ncbi:hypothetical protein VTI74DRAFT_4276 [Chaetomium olivicolor]
MQEMPDAHFAGVTELCGYSRRARDYVTSFSSWTTEPTRQTKQSRARRWTGQLVSAVPANGGVIRLPHEGRRPNGKRGPRHWLRRPLGVHHPASCPVQSRTTRHTAHPCRHPPGSFRGADFSVQYDDGTSASEKVGTDAVGVWRCHHHQTSLPDGHFCLACLHQGDRHQRPPRSWLLLAQH